MFELNKLNGVGLLGQEITKIHEDTDIDSSINFEKFLNDYNSYPVLNNKEEASSPDFKKTTDLDIWLEQYAKYDNNQDNPDLDAINKRGLILDKALKSLLDSYVEIKNEFLEDIFIKDRAVLDSDNVEIYRIPISEISKKWQCLQEYNAIFTRINELSATSVDNIKNLS